MLRAGVAVRLKRHHDAPAVRALRGLERRLDLGRVVAVVVDHCHAASLAEDGEAPLHAGKRRQRFAHDRVAITTSSATAIAASALSTLCTPGMRTVNRPTACPRRTSSKLLDSPSTAEVTRGVVGLRGQAVGRHALFDARQDVLHVRVIEAGHHQAVERHAVGELHERLLDRFVVAVVIEVLGDRCW